MSEHLTPEQWKELMDLLKAEVPERSEYEKIGPPEVFLQLRPAIRAALDKLSDEQAEAIPDIIKAYENARVVRRFGKWAVVSVITIFMLFNSVADGIIRVLHSLGWVK